MNSCNADSLQGCSVSAVTLGCKLNFAETATIVEQLCQHGARKARAGEAADICVVNTCAVTQTAEAKCRQAIHRAVRKNQGAIVAVTGCYAELAAKAIEEIEGVSIVVGAKKREELVGKILETVQHQPNASTHTDNHNATFFPSCSRGDRTRYFLKVQDGCNNYCTYCTIPIARGRSRNGSISSIVEQARQVADSGGHEIVITGVNIGDFGRSTGEHFIDLIRELDKVDGINRYRISSIEPDLLTDEIIDFCAGSRAFMPHFHIPLQSGSDEVLRLMHRHYDTQLFRSRIERIKNVMPHAFIGVDVMAGSRGETPECFESAYQFIESLDITQLHVFTYSERPGTKALEIPYVVSAADRHARTQRLIDLSNQRLQQFYTDHIGSEATVLVEHSLRHRPVVGFTENYIRVELPQQATTMAGQIVKVRLGKYNDNHDALCSDLLS
ncbi:MAG: tRNA (N(6)-L-threonylcarbamoyladenosine(37)-C(2))-methylthiotransferase MtaB [Bacteroidaceae bacterium]|nr:tRNA (N(6)-L-threonylcarbamoyladenosine(37)-C(2))-methylthiotransferase MtaB [Bacteroidaceae bacterium]